MPGENYSITFLLAKVFSLHLENRENNSEVIAIKSTTILMFEIWTHWLDHSRTFLEDLVSVEQLINVHVRRQASRFPQVTQ